MYFQPLRHGCLPSLQNTTRFFSGTKQHHLSHKGAMSQSTEELVPRWSPHSTCQPACVSPPHLQSSSVAGEPTSTWVSSLLPKETQAAPGKDSQHPADLARESLKAVSNTNGSFAPAKMQCNVFASATVMASHTGLWALWPPVWHTRVCRKAHEQGVLLAVGLHWCYLPTPLRQGTGKDRTGFFVKSVHPWGKCLAWGNLGLVNAIKRQGWAMGELPLVEGLLSSMESSWGTQEWWGHS